MHAGPWRCLKNTVLPGLRLFDPYDAPSAAACATDCYLDRHCTYYMITAAGKCVLMDWLFVGRDYQVRVERVCTCVYVCTCVHVCGHGHLRARVISLGAGVNVC
jgi:hypothetical protein